MVSYFIEICLDSNDRFQDNAEDLPFWKLPHNKCGFNRFNGAVKPDGYLYYKNKPVFLFEDYVKNARHDPGQNKVLDDGTVVKYYNTFVTDANSDDVNVWVRNNPIFFDDIPIIESHLCLYVYHTVNGTLYEGKVDDPEDEGFL
jgi:hypothetical protein